MVAWAPIVGASIAAAGMLGRGGGSGAEAKLQAAIAEFTRLEGRMPTAEEMQVVVQKFVEAGELTPSQAETVLLGPSAYEDINLDPTTRAAQADALRELGSIYNQGGLTASDKAKIMEIQDEIDTTNRGAQLAIGQNAAARGVGGSGLELAMRLNAQQQAATTGARRSTDVAALAEQRALEALMGKANLGAQMRGQDFGEASRIAEAKDAIARFNTGNRQSVINANVDRRNDAQKFNLTNRQNISNMNTAAENANRIRNADLKQREFDNRMNIAAGKTGQYQAQADLEEKRRQGDEAYRNALLGAGATILSSGGK